MGPFFRHVAARLRKSGAQVSKVNFNLADAVYFFPFPSGALYRGSLQQWPEYLAALVARRSVTNIMVFGDCRPYHRSAIECASKLGIEVYVFEEGYLRPNYITLERHGVNGYSQLPRDPAFYRSIEARPCPPAPSVKLAYLHAAFHSIVYVLICSCFGWLTPRYSHHRDIRWHRQGLLWLRGGLRRVSNTLRDRKLAQALAAGTLDYFLVPLQVHLDSQITHSEFRDVTEFIQVVVRSFAASAPKSASLVFKSHPLDRPYRDYTSLIQSLRRKHNLELRLHYVDVVNLPAALKNARGTIVINSTVGLSSLRNLVPTVCLGRAIYDMPGLTHQGTLDDFWNTPEPVDPGLLDKFVYFIRVETQLAGSVWSGLT